MRNTNRDSVSPPENWICKKGHESQYFYPDKVNCYIDTIIYYKGVHIWLPQTEWKSYGLSEYDNIKVLLESL